MADTFRGLIESRDYGLNYFWPMKINTDGMDHLNPEELEKLLALLDKYSNDQCTEEERQAIEQWYESLAGDRETSVAEELESRRKVWHTIQSATTTVEEETHTKEHSISWWRWAAVVATVCVAGIFSFRYATKKESVADNVVPGKNWIVKTNNSSLPENIQLPDSSSVTLQPHASIQYAQVFAAEERVVLFKGEAFFNIQKDPSRPFKVLTGDVTTRVLGTSFTVKANDLASVVEIDVRTGSVSVYDHTKASEATDNHEGVILTPNQRVTYYKEQSKWITELVQNPQPVVTETESVPVLIYKDNLMRDVLRDVAALYRIEIIVASEHIYNCPFTADLSQMGLHDVMKVICRSIRADYEIKGTRILINGSGCTPDKVNLTN